MTGEKRVKPREMSLTEVSYDHDGLHFEGRISDLSEGGFYIDTINPVSEGSLITFRFSLPGEGPDIAVVGEGRVAWQRPLQGMGISFTWLSDEDRNRVKAFLSRK